LVRSAGEAPRLRDSYEGLDVFQREIHKRNS
jgi:hypothetical protein